MRATQFVKRRLTILNIVIMVTGLLGVFAIFELNKGVYFHELNLAHLKNSANFERKVRDFDLSEKRHIIELRKALMDVRHPARECLHSRDFVTQAGTFLLGTNRLFSLCEEDINASNRAFELLDMVEAGTVSRVIAIAELREIALAFHQHSYDFEPLVALTVDAMVWFALLAMVLKAVAVFGVSLFSSRVILRHFNHAEAMERELQLKNKELGASLTALEKQKGEVDLAMQMAEHNALHDPLTALPNRRFLDQKAIEFEEYGEGVALLHIDVDHFKQINDTKGHDAGDFILNYVAQSLKRVIREGDFVARVGGDEFVVVIKMQDTPARFAQVSLLADRIVRTLGHPVEFNDEQCRLSVSVGVALEESHSVSVKRLISKADEALYRAKAMGRNRFEFFSAEDKGDVVRRKTLGDELITALERDEIVPFYQPQFSTHDLNIAGMEALARWIHPTKGLISPAEFLPVAQEMGLMGEVDRKIMKQAAQELMRLDAVGCYVPRVSVNISAQRLREPTFIDDLKSLSLPSERLAFELLESVYLDDTDEQMSWTLDTIRDLGIELEIDDFGSGHASILSLLGVRPNRFKIDRQVIADIHRSDTTRSLVRSIIGIGKSLDVEVLAEGIETHHHIAELQKLDCGYLQGFALAKPMKGDDLFDFLTGEQWRSSSAA